MVEWEPHATKMAQKHMVCSRIGWCDDQWSWHTTLRRISFKLSNWNGSGRYEWHPAFSVWRMARTHPLCLVEKKSLRSMGTVWLLYWKEGSTPFCVIPCRTKKHRVRREGVGDGTHNIKKQQHQQKPQPWHRSQTASLCFCDLLLSTLYLTDNKTHHSFSIWFYLGMTDRIYDCRQKKQNKTEQHKKQNRLVRMTFHHQPYSTTGKRRRTVETHTYQLFYDWRKKTQRALHYFHRTER